MTINGTQVALSVKRNGDMWGVQEKGGRLWVNATNDGWTTDLDFHGMVFWSREAAAAYVKGYNAARKEMRRFL